jgi:hypothetical protein
VCVFPGLVYGGAGSDGVIGPLNWSALRVKKKDSLADYIFISDCRFVLAWLCTGIGATGMLWLWWRWRRNYLWALNQIFMYVEVLEKSAK